MKEATFIFVLSAEHASLVSLNRDISQIKHEYPYQYQIRICQFIEPVPNESPDFLPLELLIRFGMNNCQLLPTPPLRKGTESRLPGRPIDCTKYVKLCPLVTNTININWIPDRKNCVFAMYVVKKITAETLINKIQDKGGISIEETTNYIIKKLADVDADIATTSFHFSLMCPLGKVKMKMPAKSIHCDHIQCFDARTFILMNEITPTWTCPVCNKPCLYNDLQVDNYFTEVVNCPLINDYCEKVQILGDGTWRLCEKNNETKDTNSNADTRRLIDYIEIDSDDE